MNQNQNQNQRYEARVGFKSTVFMLHSMNRGMNALMAFPGSSMPQNLASGPWWVFVFIEM